MRRFRARQLPVSADSKLVVTDALLWRDMLGQIAASPNGTRLAAPASALETINFEPCNRRVGRHHNSGTSGSRDATANGRLIPHWQCPFLDLSGTEVRSYHLRTMGTVCQRSEKGARCAKQDSRACVEVI